jgi:lysophospholipase L1-like esterase
MKSIIVIIGLLLTQISYAQRFENEIKAFERRDSLSMPKPNQILLVGSSTFRIWTTFQGDLEGYEVLNRGFGGSQMSDVNDYFNRIVAKYQPALIIVYEGDNDLANGKTPKEVAADFKTFVAKVKSTLPNTKIAFFSIRPSIARLVLLPQQKQANKLIEAYCDKEKKVTFVNIQKHFYLPDGSLMNDIFIEDKLHLNAKGYSIWTIATRKFLAKYLNK